jgi:hypothetical protein
MPDYNLRLSQVLDELWPKVVEPYYKELLEDLGELHDYSWWKPLSKLIPTSDWKSAFRNKKILPHWEYFGEGEDYPETVFQFGDQVELMLAKFGLSFMITDEYMRFADRRKDLWPDLRDWLDDFAEAALRTLSSMHAAPLLDAFNGTYFTDALDGKALCATDHTGPDGNAVSNELTAPLSLELLEAFWGLKSQFMSEHGDPISINFDTIVLAEEKEIEWYEIQNSIQKPGTNNNDRNYWYRRLTPHFCPHLREEVQTGASEFVFVVDSRRTPLRTLMAMAPSISRHMMEDGDNAKVNGKMFCNVNWPYFTGIAGSSGDGS